MIDSILSAMPWSTSAFSPCDLMRGRQAIRKKDETGTNRVSSILSTFVSLTPLLRRLMSTAPGAGPAGQGAGCWTGIHGQKFAPLGQVPLAAESFLRSRASSSASSAALLSVPGGCSVPAGLLEAGRGRAASHQSTHTISQQFWALCPACCAPTDTANHCRQGRGLAPSAFTYPWIKGRGRTGQDLPAYARSDCLCSGACLRNSTGKVFVRTEGSSTCTMSTWKSSSSSEAVRVSPQLATGLSSHSGAPPQRKDQSFLQVGHFCILGQLSQRSQLPPLKTRSAPRPAQGCIACPHGRTGSQGELERGSRAQFVRGFLQRCQGQNQARFSLPCLSPARSAGSTALPPARPRPLAQEAERWIWHAGRGAGRVSVAAQLLLIWKSVSVHPRHSRELFQSVANASVLPQAGIPAPVTAGAGPAPLPGFPQQHRTASTFVSCGW